MTVLPIDDPLADRAWSQEESTHGPDYPVDGGPAFVLLWAVVMSLRTAYQAVFGGGDVLTALVKPDDCPDPLLPYSAAIQGVRLPAGASADAQRELVNTRPARTRGRPEARKAAIREHLIATKYVRLDEQALSAYTEVLTVLGPEVATSINEVRRVANEMKPAGIVLLVQEIEGDLWVEEAERHSTWADAASAHLTWAELADRGE